MRGQDSERQFLYKVFFHQAGLGVYVNLLLTKNHSFATWSLTACAEVVKLVYTLVSGTSEQ